MEAVAGAASAAFASGSALSGSLLPSPATSANLYRVPGPTRGTNSSHTPDGYRSRIGWRRLSQVLKSPISDTARAFGAQTANRVPRTPSTVIGLAPSVN